MSLDAAVLSTIIEISNASIRRAVLLTPAHHFPHGVPLHPGRRKAVLDWAHRTDGYLLEDDYDGEFRYDRQPIGAVQGLDPDRWPTWGRQQEPVPGAAAGLDGVARGPGRPGGRRAGGQQFYVNALPSSPWPTSSQTATTTSTFAGCATYRRRRDALVQALALDFGISGLSAGLHLR